MREVAVAVMLIGTAARAAAAEFQPYDSGPVPGDGPAQKVTVDIAGVRVLRLLASCEKGVANCNIWGEPRLIAKDGTVTALTGLRPFAVSVGWGQLLVNTNWMGHPLRVGDRTFADGFWVHADSELRFRIDGKYERFEAFVGEDKDRANGVARFQVLSGDRPRPLTTDEMRAEELDTQFAVLSRDIQQRSNFQKFAAETFHPAALVLDSDRDPADIVLRRAAALCADLGASRFDGPLQALQQRNAGTPLTEPAARRALFDEACALRRRIAFSNPLLDFDGILFVKRHRAIFNHMCDQFYGIAARPGGGLYILEDPFGPDPAVREIGRASCRERV